MNKLKHTVQGVFITALLQASVSGAAETTFTIDPVHSSLQFKVRHLYSTFVGRLNTFTGTLIADKDKHTLISVSAKVEIPSIDTNNKAREKHLLSADFLLAEKYPLATFESTAISVTATNKGTVTGKMTLRGITKEVIFTGEFTGYGEDHMKGHRAGFHASTTIDRTDFGIAYNGKLPDGTSMIGEKVEIILDLEAAESAPDK